MDNTKESIRHLQNDVRDAATTVRDDLEDVARHTGHHVRELTNSAEQRLTDASGIMTIKIRDNPVQSSLIALGIGLIAGMLFKR